MDDAKRPVQPLADDQGRAAAALTEGVAQPALSVPQAVGDVERERSESAFRGAVRLLFSGWIGKAGAALFLILLGISAYVLLTYPGDFGTARWSSPAYWADNPKGAPPVWTNWLGGARAVEHAVRSPGEPVSVTARGTGEVRVYRVPFAYDADEFPGFLSATLPGITYATRAPFAAFSLLRPDGTEVRLANVVAPGPRPGEVAPYRRFYDTPERVLLSSPADGQSAQALAQVYATEYPGLTVPADLGNRLAAGLFARPAADGSGGLEPLPGEYALQIQVVVADAADQVAPPETVLGGSVYGVMGTDSLGRDLFQGLLYGFPIALLIAVSAAVSVTVIGAGLGILSGYAGGVTDAVIQRLCDIVTNVPKLPLLIFLVFVYGAKLWLIVLSLVAFSWPGLTIFVRAMVLQVRSGQLVEAARALGASRWRIMLRHVFPQVAPFVVAQMIFTAPEAILAEAGLSFLGLGDTSIPTWGQMLQAGFQTGGVYIGLWWWVIPPGVLIVFTALAFMLLALAMEPVVDPRLRARR